MIKGTSLCFLDWQKGINDLMATGVAPLLRGRMVLLFEFIAALLLKITLWTEL